MNKKAVLLWIIAFIFLVACGGGGDAEPDTPASDNDTSSSTTTETTETVEEDSAPADSEEMAEEPTEESEPTDEAESMEEDMDEEPAAEEPAEEPAEETAEEPAASDSPFGDRPMSGTDPETGLPVNPESVNPGDTFIVRGEIISMNLTPTTSPEFLIQSPDGINFRLRSQDLADTYYEDGDQLQAFQYQNGLLAQATATLAADASPSDIPTSTDLVLVKDE
ncbi:MAG: hypothetical protein CL608_13605 [Anaerolineaceae bacterium]|nr:hypothetical protein [Anaerolineaceae bacterium]